MIPPALNKSNADLARPRNRHEKPHNDMSFFVTRSLFANRGS